MEAPLLALLRRWQVVQSLLPMSSRALLPAVLSVAAVLDELPESFVSAGLELSEPPQAAASKLQDKIKTSPFFIFTIFR